MAWDKMLDYFKQKFGNVAALPVIYWRRFCIPLLEQNRGSGTGLPKCCRVPWNYAIFSPPEIQRGLAGQKHRKIVDLSIPFKKEEEKDLIREHWREEQNIPQLL